MKLYSILLIATVVGFVACKKSSTGNPIPVIAYSGMSTDSINNGSSKDTLSITFTIVDGDGDLGNNPNVSNDIFLKDSRSVTNEEIGFSMPEIPKGVIKEGNSANIHCTVNISAALYLLLRPTRPLGDTLSFDIYIKDKAGNKSNVITTHPIYIYP